MSYIDIACSALGILNGIFFALIPKMNDPRPSLFNLFGFGTVFSAAALFLAIAAQTQGEHFLTITLVTVALAVGAFIATKPLCEAQATKAIVNENPQTVTGQNTTAREKVA